MSKTALKPQKTNVFSSKTLSEGQKDLFADAIKVESSDFIKTTPNRIKTSVLKKTHENVIITSKKWS